MSRVLTGVVGLTVLAGCSSSRMETWEVAGHRAPCTGVEAELCLLVYEPGSSRFGLNYSEIEGFGPQWGHEYTINVEITEVSNPPADGSSQLVTLRKVRRDEPLPPGTTFAFQVAGPDASSFVSLTTAEAGQLLDGTRFTCGQGSGVCEEIGLRLASGEPFEITFAHGVDALSALAVVALAPAAPPAFHSGLDDGTPY